MTRHVFCQSDNICHVFLHNKNPGDLKTIMAIVTVTRFKSWKQTYSTSRFLIIFPDPKTSATRDTMGS